MDSLLINKELLENLFEQAKESDRHRMNFDLRTSPNDGSQRMLNAMLPGTKIAIHRHPMSNECVFLLSGEIVEVMYDDNGIEAEQIHLDLDNGQYGCVVPKGVWHKIQVLKPSVIVDAKDCRYGQDGSETLDEYKTKIAEDPSQTSFSNCLGDLKKNIEYLIGMERQSGSMDVITPLYVSRMLNVPLEEVESAMKELELI